MIFSVGTSLLLSASVLGQAGLIAAQSDSAPSAAYRPPKIAYSDLVADEESFSGDALLGALGHVGMISVTGIPGMADMKRQVLTKVDACARLSMAVQTHTFGDGTVRRTLATHTVPGPGGVQEIHHHDDDANDGDSICHDFAKDSKVFRSTVAEVTNAFAVRLSSLLDISPTPLLSTKGGEFPFPSVAEVVEFGEHLEHFHAYQADAVGRKGTHVANSDDTIELHTDQGLFLVFTPGVLVPTDADAAASAATTISPTGGFYIQLEDGSTVEVHFDETDDLVVMLGDGVNQYINPKIANGVSLRATPHSLSMPTQDESYARAWYGRMVLPPAQATHPDHPEYTFGDIRQMMNDPSLRSDREGVNNLDLGCSSTLVTRQLEETTCEADTLMCWHRCMNTTEFGVSPEICAEQGLSMMCINPRGQLWDNTHGDFFPGCAAPDAELNTPYPQLPNYPRDDEVCTDSQFQSFVSAAGVYEHSIDLGNNATFMWTVDGELVDGMLAFNGIFGWLAIGLANVGGGKNGMHGADVIMAIPGGNYSAVTGLDLTMGPTVSEYIIHPTESSFRHWQDPVVSVMRAQEMGLYGVDVDECFTALTFKTSAINGKLFNLTGTDELLWAANNVDYFVGYHGQNRGRFAVDWSNGEATLNGAQEDIEDHDDHDHDAADHDHDLSAEEDTSDTSTLNLRSVFVYAVAALMLLYAY